ncbi:MAG: protein kinase [Solirubrobacteraceae bacterium]|nr:protein kinase [Solirubrobacteraceae bacterium]
MPGSPLAMPQPGDRVGPYRLLSIAGQGGMGVVYRAADTLLSDRAVAVKVMAAHLSTTDAYRTAFLHEAQVAAEVSHPHVVPVHAAGEDGGLLYLAMAWIEGEDLRELARSGGVSVDRIIGAVRQVARALDALHRAGIVHGDVKPSNVILHRGGEDDHAYLVDFGVARRVDYGDPRTNELVGGTPAYCAPEVTHGKAGPESDQYALACVLFELVTGSKPFGSGSPTVLAQRHRAAERPRISEFTPALGYLDEVVMRAMAVDPADRFASGAAFGRALDAAQLAASGAPTVVHPAVGAADPDETDPLGGATTGVGTAPMGEPPQTFWTRAAAEAEPLVDVPGDRTDVRLQPRAAAPVPGTHRQPTAGGAAPEPPPNGSARTGRSSGGSGGRALAAVLAVFVVAAAIVAGILLVGDASRDDRDRRTATADPAGSPGSGGNAAAQTPAADTGQGADQPSDASAEEPTATPTSAPEDPAAVAEAQGMVSGLITTYAEALDEGDAEKLEGILASDVQRVGSDGVTGACVTDSGRSAALARWRAQFPGIDRFVLHGQSDDDVTIDGRTATATVDYSILDQPPKPLRFTARRTGAATTSWKITRVVAPCRRG